MPIPKILNPNCSEQVFRLVGDLAEIKCQVLNMLDDVEECWRGYGKITKKDLDILKEKREEVRKVKDLEDFNLMCFEFTTNYETFFKTTDNNDLCVATCNNIEWNSVDYIEESSDDYFKIANYDYFNIMLKNKDYIVVESKYDKKKERYYFESVDNSELSKLFDNSVKVIKRKGNFLIVADKLIKVKEIIDKDKLEKIRKLLVLLKLE